LSLNSILLLTLALLLTLTLTPAGSSPTSARASIDGRADGMFGSATPTPHHEPAFVQQQVQAMPFRQDLPVIQQQPQVRGRPTEGPMQSSLCSQAGAYGTDVDSAYTLIAHALDSSRSQSALCVMVCSEGHDQGQLPACADRPKLTGLDSIVTA